MNPSSRLTRLLTAGACAIAAAALSVACGGGTTTPDPPPQTTPTLVSVSVSPATVVGGNTVQGTVTLTAAPTSAATVTLSSNNAAATPSGTATVNAGATSATFNVTTAVVAASTAVGISAAFGGATQSTTLTVTPVPPPTLVANFVVTSLSPARRKTDKDNDPVTILPAGTADACPLINSGNPELDCLFNAATSTGSIVKYVWTYSFGTKQQVDETESAQMEPKAAGCGFFGNQEGATRTDGAVQFIQMTVQLQLRDSANNLSAPKMNQNVRIFPAGNCGYGF